MSNNALIESLIKVLADSYALQIKSQNYHWNVQGPHFSALHTLFEQHYADLAVAIDEIAESIRALGAKAPGSLPAYHELSSIGAGNENADAIAMVKDLTKDQAIIEQTLNAALELASDAGDEVVSDLLIGRLTIHRKNKWMLDSIAA